MFYNYQYFLRAKDFWKIIVLSKKFHQSFFSRLTEKSGKYFLIVREISPKTFSTKSAHALTNKTKLSPTAQKLPNTFQKPITTGQKPVRIPILRRDLNSGPPRAFAGRFSQKTP
jgi:hypothetical protein